MQSKFVLSSVLVLVAVQQVLGAVTNDGTHLSSVEQVKFLHQHMADYTDTPRCLKFLLVIDQNIDLSESNIISIAQLNLWRTLTPSFNFNKAFLSKVADIEAELRRSTSEYDLLANELHDCTTKYASNMCAGTGTEWMRS